MIKDTAQGEQNEETTQTAFKHAKKKFKCHDMSFTCFVDTVIVIHKTFIIFFTPLPSAECGGGQEDWPCGKPCPRSCSDLHGDTECLDPRGCSQTCGCPGDKVLQDGVCVSREQCRCRYHNISAAGQPQARLFDDVCGGSCGYNC